MIEDTFSIVGVTHIAIMVQHLGLLHLRIGSVGIDDHFATHRHYKEVRHIIDLSATGSNHHN